MLKSYASCFIESPLLTASGTQDISCLISPGYELGFNLAENAGVFQQRVWRREDSEETTAGGLTSVRDIHPRHHAAGRDESTACQEGKPPRHVSPACGTRSERASDAEKRRRGREKEIVLLGSNFRGNSGRLLIFSSTNPVRKLQLQTAVTIQSQPCRYPFLSHSALGASSPLKSPHTHSVALSQHPLHPFLPAACSGCFLFLFFLLHLGGLVVKEAKKLKPPKKGKGEKVKFSSRFPSVHHG